MLSSERTNWYVAENKRLRAERDRLLGIAVRAVESLLGIYEQDGELPEGHWLIPDRDVLRSLLAAGPTGVKP